MAGIDCALWDLKGKIAGVPTARLLSETPQMRIKLYASSGCMYDWRKNPHQLIEEALGYIDMGYKAMKFRVGTEWTWDGVTVDRYLGLVRELHQAVAGRMELMAEGNQRLTEEDAIKVAQELDRLGGFGWLEEPIPADQIDGYARIAAIAQTPVSGGEGKTTLEQFRPYLEKRAYDIVQPDAGLCGISECLRIGKMAYRYGIDLIPHSWHNGLMCMENAHMVAALPNPRYLELCMIQGPLQWAILANPPTIEDGYLILPDKPGLGVELAENLEERFPYIEGHYAIQVQR
ncbi:MAG: mandelate racemase/muconate lactonizing enzyme family protein [Chloroflexi bacterium]|nr:mandelate racemase/muconate lactonizing enzyme family protein [Chloroflexota bacterium]